jgi:hypothetical protein
VTKPDFLALFRSLSLHGVEYVVVGGVAAILEGAPISTLDLDIVYRVEDANLRRLRSLLIELEARYRDPAGREIEPTVERLRANRVNLLETRQGLLDAMQEIGAGWSYEDLVSRTRTHTLGELEVRVLDLASVIESKQAAGRDKDMAMLPVLRQTLEV